MKKTKLMSVLGTAVTVFFGACWSGGAQAAGPWNDNALGAIKNYDPSGQCADLMGMQILPQNIGLPTGGEDVTSAVFVRATDPGNTYGEYCRVLGAIHPVDPTAPDINFRVNLPTNWNGKAFQPGGGGYDGNIPNTTGKTTLGSGTPPLTLGYMTFADDSGHTALDSNDASFAVNDEALNNFGYMHIKKARDVAFEIARARYGKWPKRLYFSGGSTGGREGLTAAQRWPDDYDGILSNYPTANFLGLRLWGSFLEHAEYPDQSKPPTNCLTPTFIARTNQVYHRGYTLPYPLANGIVRYEGYNSLESVIMDLGTNPHLFNPVQDGPNAHHVARADQFVKYFVTRDPNFNLDTFDPVHPGVWLAKVQSLSQTIDATDPDLGKFMHKGGKIIWLHGTEDASVAPFANARYYETIAATMGQSEADKFIRFYMVPGLAHGGGK